MKILHTADWHIGNFPGPERDGRNLRLDDTIACLHHMIDTVKTSPPDLAVVSGDIFHQARVWADRGLSEVKIAIDLIEDLSAFCPTVILRGTPNHDGKEQFEMLKRHFKELDPNHRVWVVDCPRTYQIILNNQEGINVSCLPGFDRGAFRAKFPGLSREEENLAFADELGRIVLGLKAECSAEYPSILLSHYTVPGANTESGQTQFLSKFEPIIIPDILDAAGFDLVALGHIHRPQQLISCRNTFYSGAINANNFGDEGQERGFYIHDMTANVHTFYKSPSRSFVTYHFSDQEITEILNGGIDEVANHHWKGRECDPSIIDGAIVRVLYSCNEEKNKAFNRSVLEQRLYADGAFWVQEITPEKIEIGVARNELSEQCDPEANLRSYLQEKAFADEEIAVILPIARPLISEALAGNITSHFKGTFLPLSITVKNYRNYIEESFDFRDITFCTINGRNGSGKSSLFMDAILDCLFEEPREGELTGWIRADDKARSGSIAFEFSIGDQTFRVVRTRTKSGKATLNIAELVNGEWEDRSREKIRDTQDEIVRILGMDSMTFRACALIMQDQYGLFLQASKEERMGILGNILGLGIYSTMEELTRAKATEVNRLAGQAKDRISQLAERIKDIGFPEHKKIELEQQIMVLQKDQERLSYERDQVQSKLSTKLEAGARSEKIKDEISSIELRMSSARSNLELQKRIINEAEDVLSERTQIEAMIRHRKDLEEKEKSLMAMKGAYVGKLSEIKNATDESVELEKEVNANIEQINQLISQKNSLNAEIAKESLLCRYADEYAEKKKAISALEEKTRKYIDFSALIANEKTTYGKKLAEYTQGITERTAHIKKLHEKASLLKDCNCLSIEQAECAFLSDAKIAEKEIDPYTLACTTWKNKAKSELEEIETRIKELEKERDELGFDSNAQLSLKLEMDKLEPFKQKFDQLPNLKEQLKIIDEQILQISQSRLEKDKRVSILKERINALHIELKNYEASVQEYKMICEQIMATNIWVEREKLLPVAKERKRTAEVRLAELQSEVDDTQEEITKKRNELALVTEIVQGANELRTQLNDLDESIGISRKKSDMLQIDLGSINQQIRDFHTLQENMQELQNEVNSIAEKATAYDVLKVAFSQDGIPHNIIRSIIPSITATANGILGQMTGGRMGLEFVTEKVLKSNSKKEVTALDILIQDHGKDTLPYLSKSGGEKVKASLSVILALAEVKSSQAGIQLGMLFIDEPPFLDDEGTQAYCDSLETIQSRYSNLKVMAITHDPAMKARFPQSIDIEKTEEGSRVVYA